MARSVQLLKLLKSKQLAMEAKSTLKMLHGRCFSLKNVLTTITDCLGMDKALPGVGKGKMGKKAKRGSISQNLSVGTPKGGSCTEVIEWMADSVGEERLFREESRDRDGPKFIEGTTLSSVIAVFLAFVENRDVKCRRAAQDGLVGSLVYKVVVGDKEGGGEGNPNLDLDKDGECKELLEPLQTTSVKIYNAVLKQVKEELARELVKRSDMQELAEEEEEQQQQQQQQEQEEDELDQSNDYHTITPPRPKKKTNSAHTEVEVGGAAAVLSPRLSDLAARWGEVQYLLRKPPMKQGDVEGLKEGIEKGAFFLKALEVESARLGMLRGTLSRCILPYDENTSTLDQANVSGVCNPEDEKKVVGISAEDMVKMKEGAVALRGLIRVKIADDGDLALADTSLNDVATFFKMLEAESMSSGVEAFTLLRKL